MMKIKVLREFMDVPLGRVVKTGEQISVADKRGEQLVQNGLAINEGSDPDPVEVKPAAAPIAPLTSTSGVAGATK